MYIIALLIAILIVAQLTFISYSTLRRRWQSKKNTEAVLYALSTLHPTLSILSDTSLEGSWKERPVKIEIRQNGNLKNIFIEMETAHPQDLRLIMTPQVELFENHFREAQLLHFFSVFQFPNTLFEMLESENPNIFYKIVTAWLTIDPRYPFDCFHKVEGQKQTLKLPGDCDVVGLEAGLVLLRSMHESLQLIDETIASSVD